MFARAYEEDRIVVTFNCDDFKKLGLVRKALGQIADELIAGRDMINRVLRIWVDSAHVFDPLP